MGPRLIAALLACALLGAAIGGCGGDKPPEGDQSMENVFKEADGGARKMPEGTPENRGSRAR